MIQICRSIESLQQSSIEDMAYQIDDLPNTSCSAEMADLVESSCFDADSTTVKVVRVLPYLFIILISVVGNILVTLVVFNNRPMRKAVNFFIVNMALSDLLITLVYMPRVVSIILAGYEWLSTGVAGLVFCKLVYFIHETSVSVSIFSAVCISGERFLAVIRPLQSLTKNTKAARYLISLTWFLSSVIRVPILVANTTAVSCGKTYCKLALDTTLWSGVSVMYHKFNLIGMYATPLGVMIALYSATIFTLKRRGRPGNRVTAEPAQPTEVNKKVSRMVLVVITAFILCWILYFIVAVLESYHVSISCNVLYLRLLFAHFNCALTPVLYALFSENYRREFKNILFSCSWFQQARSRASTLSTPSSRRAWTLETNFSLDYQKETGHVGPAALGDVAKKSEAGLHK